MLLHDIAREAIKIYNAHEEASHADAGFDGGEFSGPAHYRMADKEITALAELHGFTFDEVISAMSDELAADDGPYGRIS